MRERTYQAGGLSFTRNSVEDALEAHKTAGNIATWRRNYQVYEVWLFGDDYWRGNLAEANALLCGLNSAVAADNARRAAEAQALAAYKASQAAEAAERKAAEVHAVESVRCGFCGSEAGTRCVRDAKDVTPYADHPHALRMERAAVTTGASGAQR